MSLPTPSNAPRNAGPGRTTERGPGLFHDPGNVHDVFLGAFRRDIQAFYPGSRIEREPGLVLAGQTFSTPRSAPASGLEFQLDATSDFGGAIRVGLFGAWYRLSLPCKPAPAPRDLELIRAIGQVMEMHHQALFGWSRVTLLQLRRGMPEDHYVAAAVDPFAYEATSSSLSRIADAILTLRTMALSTYENRRVTTGTLILGQSALTGSLPPSWNGPAVPEALTFGVELTALKTLHRLCDGRRTVFLVDEHGKLADVVDIRRWASRAVKADHPPLFAVPRDEPDAIGPLLSVPCPRMYTYHALATQAGGHVCLVLSPNQEIKVFAGGVQAFVFAHGRWRVLDPESKFALWAEAVAHPRLAHVLFQTALDLAEERQGGLLVVVSDPEQVIGRLVPPYDVLEMDLAMLPELSAVIRSKLRSPW